VHNVAGSYDTTRKANVRELTASGQYVIFLGATQTASSYQVGNTTDLTSTDPTASAWSQFDATGSLHDRWLDLDTQRGHGFPELCHHCPELVTDSLLLPGYPVDNDRRTIGRRHGAGPDGCLLVQHDGDGLLHVARAGKTVSTSDTGVNTAYLRNLVVIKNSQNPVTASSPRPRTQDRTVTRRGCETRHLTPWPSTLRVTTPRPRSIGNGWRPIKSQAAIGIRPTTYGPETMSRSSNRKYDSVGEFLVGVYRTLSRHRRQHLLDDGVAGGAGSGQLPSNRMLAPMDSVRGQQHLGTDRSDNTFSEAFYVAWPYGPRRHSALTKSNPTDGRRVERIGQHHSVSDPALVQPGAPRASTTTPPATTTRASRHRDHRTRRSTLRPRVDCARRRQRQQRAA